MRVCACACVRVCVPVCALCLVRADLCLRFPQTTLTTTHPLAPAHACAHALTHTHAHTHTHTRSEWMLGPHPSLGFMTSVSQSVSRTSPTLLFSLSLWVFSFCHVYFILSPSLSLMFISSSFSLYILSLSVFSFSYVYFILFFAIFFSLSLSLSLSPMCIIYKKNILIIP